MKENRLQGALKFSEAQKMERVEKNESKRGRTDLPPEQRKFTQQEAAAYCDVSPTTIKRWEAQGLKSVKWGKMRRYMISDLNAFIIKERQK